MSLSKRYIGGFNALAYDAHIRLDRLRSRVIRRRLEHDPGILLIHIPKCAGVSLRHSLNLPNPGHKLLCDFSKEELRKARRIVFCTREPFDRLVSAFHYVQQFWGRNPLLNAAIGLPQPSSFTDFVQSGVLEQLEAYHYFFRSQYQYLKGIEFYGRKAVHLRFETLADDFKLHFGRPLDRMNASKQLSYAPDVDTAENRERISSIYRADYDLLPKLVSA